MGTPYLRRGLRLGDRPVTTTGVSYATDDLHFNDYLAADWMERTGSTPFTGAYYHTVPLTYGYSTKKTMTLKPASKLFDFMSGARIANRQHFPRQAIQYSIERLTPSEMAKYQLFYQMIGGNTEVIEFIDENDNAIPVRWTGGFQMDKDKNKDAARPYSLTITLEVELTSRDNAFTSGGQITY